MTLAWPRRTSVRNATERFEVIDMVRTDDRSRSFAIDAFPEMSEEAIEEFSIRNVERRRALREQAFEELELDACAAGLCDDGDDAASYLERSSSSLLEELKDSSQYPDRRRRAQDALERRAKEDRLRHLVDLHARSSYELDQIASNEGDFAVRRALAQLSTSGSRSRIRRGKGCVLFGFVAHGVLVTVPCSADCGAGRPVGPLTVGRSPVQCLRLAAVNQTSSAHRTLGIIPSLTALDRACYDLILQ